jgi:hypothetical protein
MSDPVAPSDHQQKAPTTPAVGTAAAQTGPRLAIGLLASVIPTLLGRPSNDDPIEESAGLFGMSIATVPGGNSSSADGTARGSQSSASTTSTSYPGSSSSPGEKVTEGNPKPTASAPATKRAAGVSDRETKFQHSSPTAPTGTSGPRGGSSSGQSDVAAASSGVATGNRFSSANVGSTKTASKVASGRAGSMDSKRAGNSRAAAAGITKAAKLYPVKPAKLEKKAASMKQAKVELAKPSSQSGSNLVARALAAATSRASGRAALETNRPSKSASVAEACGQAQGVACENGADRWVNHVSQSGYARGPAGQGIAREWAAPLGYQLQYGGHVQPLQTAGQMRYPATIMQNVQSLNFATPGSSNAGKIPSY